MSKHFALISDAGYLAPQHMQAIKTIGKTLFANHEFGITVGSLVQRIVAAAPAFAITAGPKEDTRMEQTAGGVRPS